MYSILLYYKYIKLQEPEKIISWQKELCSSLGLKGRIIVAREGINGTVEGTDDNIRKYIEETKSFVGFDDIDFKKSRGTGNAFPKLSVKYRNEIVTLGRPEMFPVPSQTGADYISADELHSLFENKPDDFVLLDMRNDYELKVGKFDKTIELPAKNFRDIPTFTNTLQQIKNKTVVAVCTGGVRCEKGTAYLKQELGFEKVYQLHNGIVSYIDKYPKGYFKGSLYVFDGRVTMRTEGMSNEVIGSCELCKSTSETYVNCSIKGCHRHFIICSGCQNKSDNFAGSVCGENHSEC